MLYYEAEINIVNGKKRYGNLPYNYTVAHENTTLNKAYFPMVKAIEEPHDGVVEITEEAYNTALSEIENMINDDAKQQLELTKAKLLERENRIAEIENNNKVLAVGLVETYESQIATDTRITEESNTTLLALADAYELIMQLKAEIETLKGENV